MNLKAAAKFAAQGAVFFAQPALQRSQAGQLLVLMYHRVLPADSPKFEHEQPGMRITPETLAAHLVWIKRHFSPVTLGDWVAGKVTPSRRPACAITFDDGWADNYEYALPPLREAGLPATVFLVADYIGTTRDFWPGRVQRLLSVPLQQHEPTAWQWIQDFRPLQADRSKAPAAAESDAIITSLKQLPDEVIEEHLANAEQIAGIGEPSEPVMLDWAQVREMVADGTFSVGSHTCRHRRLNTDRSFSSLRDEVVRSKVVIEENAGVTPGLFCYPNGDVSPDAEVLVREHYAGACLVKRGWNKPGGDPFKLQRLGMHEDVSQTRIQFIARCMGIG